MKNNPVPKTQIKYNANKINKLALARKKQDRCFSMITKLTTCILLLFAIVMLSFYYPERNKNFTPFYPYDHIPFGSPVIDRSQDEHNMPWNDTPVLVTINFKEFCHRIEQKRIDVNNDSHQTITIIKRKYKDIHLEQQTLMQNAKSQINAARVLSGKFQDVLYNLQYSFSLIRGLR